MPVNRFSLDSGAFTAFQNPKIKIDIDEYIEFVKNHEHVFEHCFNLDVIGNDKASYENWKYLQKNGVNSIPVFHLGTDEKWLTKYINETDYLGLGAVANLHTVQRKLGFTRIWKDYLIDKHGMPKLKVHAMGVTALDIMTQYPWYSVDSASIIKQSAYGAIYLPEIVVGRKKPNFFKMKVHRVSDQGTYTGTTGFLGLPRLLQEKYTEYIESFGFELGQIIGQEVRPKRCDKGKEPRQEGLFDKELIKEPGTNETLANNGIKRHLFNLHMWGELFKRLPSWYRKWSPNMPSPKESEYIDIPLNERTRVYTVYSNRAYMNEMEKLNYDYNVLCSYAYMGKEILKNVKKLAKI